MKYYRALDGKYRSVPMKVQGFTAKWGGNSSKFQIFRDTECDIFSNRINRITRLPLKNYYVINFNPITYGGSDQR